MHRAFSVAAGVDLRPFLDILRVYTLPHHVTEEAGTLVVWAASLEQGEAIAELWQQWQDGRLQAGGVDQLAQTLASGSKPAAMLPVRSLLQGFLRALWRAPITVVLMLACLAVALVSQLGADVMAVRALFFPGVPSLADLDSVSDWLRTLTPALLHFGPVHLVFNLLWLWFFGRMMEPVLGKAAYALLLLWTAFAANVLQYLWSDSVNFGGMSGVVYGQLGCIWMWQTRRPQSAMRLPPAMIMVFLVALVLMEILASSMIASAAHAGGLLAGMVAGLILSVVLNRTNRGSRHNV